MSTSNKRPADKGASPPNKNRVLESTATISNIIAQLQQQLPNNDLVSQLNQAFDNHLQELTALLQTESPEEKERKRSLVVIGLPESTSEKPSERVKSDHDSITTMLDTLDVGAKPVAIYRMGRIDNSRKGPRLIKVAMPTSFYQRQTLGALKTKRQQLRNVPNFQRVLVRPSLTPEQLKEDRELRARLKEKRAQNPGMKIFISKGQITVDNSIPTQNFH